MLTMRRRDNIMIKRVVCVGALCLAFAGASLQAGTLILGDPPMPNTGNCDPFGCPAFFGLGTYQQVYLSTAFPGAITIDALTFFQGQILNNGGLPAGGTYTLTFSNTSAAPGNLNLTDPNGNIGSGNGGFFTGNLTRPHRGWHRKAIGLYRYSLRVQSGRREPVADGGGNRRHELPTLSLPGRSPVRSEDGLPHGLVRGVEQRIFWRL